MNQVPPQAVCVCAGEAGSERAASSPKKPPSEHNNSQLIDVTGGDRARKRPQAAAQAGPARQAGMTRAGYASSPRPPPRPPPRPLCRRMLLRSRPALLLLLAGQWP